MVIGRETVRKGVEESAAVGSIERALMALLLVEVVSLESEGIEDAVVEEE